MPPDVPGLITVTVIVPAIATDEAGIEAVNWLALTNPVAVAVPFQLTVALLAKLVPFTVSTKAALPAVMLAGASAVMVGMVPAAGGVVDFEL
jgi:hypothetical protein